MFSCEIAAAITFVYVCIGAVMMAVLDDIHQWYMALLFFMYFKVLLRYDKCTISYIECKARGVPKTEGYLYGFLDSFHRLREYPVILSSVTAYVALMSYAYFVVLGKRMRV